MSLVLSFLLALLVAVTVNAQATSSCQQNYGSVADAFNAVNMGALPTDKFNKDCLSKDCDNLNFIPCPFNAGSKTEHNVSAINDFLIPETLKCLGSATTICGVQVNNIPYCNFGVVLNTLSPSQNLDGNALFTQGKVTITPGQITYGGSPPKGNITVTLMYMSQVQVPSGSSFPLTVTVNANVIINVDSANEQTPVTIDKNTVTNTFVADTSKITDATFKSNLEKDLMQLNMTPLDQIGKDVGLFLGKIFANVCLVSQVNCKA